MANLDKDYFNPREDQIQKEDHPVTEDKANNNRRANPLKIYRRKAYSRISCRVESSKKYPKIKVV